MNNCISDTAAEQAAEVSDAASIEANIAHSDAMDSKEVMTDPSLVEAEELAAETASPASESKIQTASSVPIIDASHCSQQKLMVMAAAGFANYWHDSDGEAFATIEMKGKTQNVKVRSREFKTYLCWRSFQDFGISPSGQCVEDVIRAKEGEARFEGPEYQTAVRVTGDDCTSYINRANDENPIIRVSSAGVSDAMDAADASFQFLWKSGMRPLPVPLLPSTKEEAIETLERLRGFCNVEDDCEWLLFLVALLSALRPNGPYIIVLVVGEQGSCKSTLCKVFRRLTDPSKAPLRSFPRDERELLIAATNCRVLVFDNVSKVSLDMSDALCRIATGGGASFRTLYENDTETILQVQRLIVLNTIVDLSLRGDIIDRSIQITCTRVNEKERLPESEFWSSFEEQESKFFGALLSILSAALKELPDVNLAESPRMADFTRFGIAVEKALGFPDGTFLYAYEGNRKGMAAAALEDHLAQLLLRIELPLELSPSELWNVLQKTATTAGGTLPRWFPRNPQQLSSNLRRIAPFLRENGIHIEFKKSGSRLVSLRRA